MRIKKVKLWIHIVYSALMSFTVFLGIVLYAIFKLYVPFKWRMWRAASKFRNYLIEEGIPKREAEEITKSQFKSISIIAIWRWWRVLGREK